MSEWTKVTAQDGHELSAYIARPEGTPVGALVVIQEIFGVNAHIRSVADGYAKDGFLCVAPALFDRIERDLQLSYSPEDMKKAFSLYPQLKPDLSLLDVAAAAQKATELAGGKKLGTVGFCYGGLVSWLSSTRGPDAGFHPSACVCYYPGGIGNVAKEQPFCPVMVHFGGNDSHIGPDQVEAVRSAHPDVQVFVYAGASHAFNRDPDPNSYSPEAARLARERSLAFLKQNLV